LKNEILRLAQNDKFGRADSALGFFSLRKTNRLKVMQNQGEQFPGGAFEEVVGKARGEPGGFQVVFYDEDVPFLDDGGYVACRGPLAP
jgi:hypothetical protein